MAGDPITSIANRDLATQIQAIPPIMRSAFLYRNVAESIKAKFEGVSFVGRDDLSDSYWTAIRACQTAQQLANELLVDLQTAVADGIADGSIDAEQVNRDCPWLARIGAPFPIDNSGSVYTPPPILGDDGVFILNQLLGGVRGLRGLGVIPLIPLAIALGIALLVGDAILEKISYVQRYNAYCATVTAQAASDAERYKQWADAQSNPSSPIRGTPPPQPSSPPQAPQQSPGLFSTLTDTANATASLGRSLLIGAAILSGVYVIARLVPERQSRRR